MSTRCEIHIEGKKYRGKVPVVKLYHHFDGYPSGVGCDLMEHVYPILQSSNKVTPQGLANELIKAEWDDGYEDAGGIHGDIEYLYLINIPKKTIKCYNGHYKLMPSHEYKFEASLECDLTVFLPVRQTIKYN